MKTPVFRPFQQTGRLVAHLLTIAFTASCAMAQPPGESPWWVQHDLGPMLESRPAGEKNPQSEKGERPLVVLPEIENPALELLNGEGFPLGWSAIGAPEILKHPDGRVTLRANNLNGLRQQLDRPVPWQHLGFAFRAKGELGGEVATVASFFPGREEDILFRNSSGVVEQEFKTLYGTIPILPGGDTMEIQLLGILPRYWVEIDEVALFGENFLGGDFEDEFTTGGLVPWVLEGGARLTTDTVRGGERALYLPPGASATATVAAMEGWEQYVEEFHVLFDPRKSLPIGIDRVFLDSGGAEISIDQEIFAITYEPIWKRVFRTPPKAPPAGARAARITFKNLSDVRVHIDDMVRGFMTVTPDPFVLDHPEPDAAVRFIASWPGFLKDDFRIRLSDSMGTTVASFTSPVLSQRASVAEWIPPADLEPGSYQVNIATLDSATTSISSYITDTELIARPPYGDPVTLDPPGGFPIGAWTYLVRTENTEDAIRPILEASQADGYTYALVFANTEQWPLVASICEDIGHPFVAGDFALLRRIRAQQTLAPFSFAEWEALIAETIAPALASPACIGHYVVDEPFTRESWRRAHAAIQMATVIPNGKGTLMAMAGGTVDDGIYDVIEPPIHFSPVYRHQIGQMDDAEQLRAVSNLVEAEVARATARGVPYWFLPQAFGDPELFRLPTPEASRAYVGVALAHGAKGLVPFLWQAIGGLEGTRTLNLDPTPIHAAWNQEIARVTALSDLLLGVAGHARVPTASGNFLATTATDAAGSTVLFLVNYETRAAQEIVLVPQDNALRLIDAETGVELPSTSGNTVVVLDPGHWRAFLLRGGGSHEFQEISSRIIVPADDSLALPVLLDRTFPGLTIWDADFTADGVLWAAAAETAIVSGSREGQSASQIPSAGQARRIAHIDNGAAYVADWLRGVYRFEHAEQELLPSFLNQTGLAYDIAAGGDFIAISMAEWGVRRLAEVEGETFLASDGVIFPDNLAFSLHGPLDGGEILFSDYDAGLTLWPGPEGGDVAEQADGLRWWRGAVSVDESLLAVARNALGFSLHRLDEDGQVTQSRRHSGLTHWAENMAWIGPRQLAVADTEGHVLFFDVGEDLAVEPAGRWNRGTFDAALLALASDGATRLLLGYDDGRVILLNVQDLAPAGWMLY
ncbi:MAG: hypothetical protein RLY93_15850 [Sumerlaeia bacterium]